MAGEHRGQRVLESIVAALLLQSAAGVELALFRQSLRFAALASDSAALPPQLVAFVALPGSIGDPFLVPAFGLR